METQVKHDGNGKFYMQLGEDEAAIQYEKLSENEIDFQHTYVPENYRGQGIAEKIAETALAYARENNLKVFPSCRFVNAFIKRNREYQDLL